MREGRVLPALGSFFGLAHEGRRLPTASRAPELFALLRNPRPPAGARTAARIHPIGGRVAAGEQDGAGTGPVNGPSPVAGEDEEADNCDAVPRHAVVGVCEIDRGDGIAVAEGEEGGVGEGEGGEGDLCWGEGEFLCVQWRREG